MTDAQRLNQKYQAQHSAPLFWVDQYDGNQANEFRVQLTNLGLHLRPDLFDAHTLHWHGFRNVIPFFDGEPSGSVSVPAGREFTYVYRPREPGTYMFHCHVEDVEHVHMGMTGMVFVRPAPRRARAGPGRAARRHGRRAPMGYVYNDGVALDDPASTAYDREFSMFLSEVWAEAHWADAHIQLPEWSDYKADFALLNGRVYPDTTAPNGPGVDAFAPRTTRTTRSSTPTATSSPRGPPGAPVPADLLARHLRDGRAGGPAVRQPGLPRVGDDHHRDPDAGRRPRRHADAGPRRDRLVVRDRHPQHRPR